MAIRKFFTSDEVNEAKEKLSQLPDLSHNRILRVDALESLKSEILALANQRGYSAADIKHALDKMNFNFSEKSISEVIRSSKTNKKRGDKAKEAIKEKGVSPDTHE